MKINNVYIGGWFQRTMLQLSEIYDFLREATTKLALDQDKLIEYRKNLQIGRIDYGVQGEEYIEFTTALNIKVKIFEDGLIILNNHNVSEDTLFADIDALTDYFTDNEATIFITLQKDKILYYYIPVVNSCELLDIKKQTYNTSNYQWFIRTSPTGELRLSCYKLITA